jgi:hypothetical protein
MTHSFRLLSLGSAAWLVTACSAPPPPAPAAPPPPSPVERGKYIVNAGGCNDCHTPFKIGPQGPEPDMTRALSGHPEDVKITAAAKLPAGWMFAGSEAGQAFSGPWGVSFPANLTPDDNTGIGIWTEAMFIAAIRTGKHMGQPTSRDILPPMPWQSFRNFNDDDLKAVYAYLKSIPPIKNRVPDPIPPAGPPPGAKGK